ncbi:transcription antitermination factor NusB [Afifella pfennigii]|uniref:transcription antitermination factor NusB n=1 Tax=Afifella pfennigii TaxID=209897 RepID=UPI0004799DFD|nr:transcription antitermination factor NusB [Afifella pfennigii]
MPQAEPEGASKAANQRGAARLAAVQALYQMDVGGVSLPRVVAEFETYRLGQELEGVKLKEADAAFFRLLVAGVVADQTVIDPIIHATLPPTWPLSRLDVTLRALLRCGVYELRSRRDVPARVVISEYLDVAHAFFDNDKPGLVNAVLDKVAHDLRPEEFDPALTG